MLLPHASQPSLHHAGAPILHDIAVESRGDDLIIQHMPHRVDHAACELGSALHKERMVSRGRVHVGQRPKRHAATSKTMQLNNLHRPHMCSRQVAPLPHTSCLSLFPPHLGRCMASGPPLQGVLQQLGHCRGQLIRPRHPPHSGAGGPVQRCGWQHVGAAKPGRRA